jgi:phosphatidylserine synthase
MRALEFTSTGLSCSFAYGSCRILLLAECAARVVYTADSGCFDGLPIHAALFAVEASAVAELVHTF